MSGRSKKKAAAVPSSAPVSPAGEMPERKDSRPLKSKSPVSGWNNRWLVFGVCLFLATITFAVFGQTLRHGFVNYDDGVYVYENPVVTRGLSWKGVEWAFTHSVVSNWHPLTMMSHMLDCQMYGLKAGGHHLTNILLHTATAILLFLVLRRMTGFLWRSAFVAAVFAIHPLRVESVAWVAERKDVLSGLFFMLTLWAYVRYAQRVTRDRCPAFVELRRGKQVTGTKEVVPTPDVSRFTFHVSLFYCLVLFFFALGLMCKPMLVTLPLVLLLLDYWPLGRVTGDQWRVTGGKPSILNSQLSTLLLEKLPLLALTGAACMATMAAQKNIIVPVPVGLRIGNAVVSYVVYLRQMVCPQGLAVLYPYPRGLPGWEITLAVLLVAAISAGVFLRRQRQPYLLMGWLWYLGMLVPAIGLIQSGIRAHADRYTYLPQIGLYFALTWAAADLCAGWRHRRVVLGGGSAIILAALIFCAHTQTSYWRNSESLWTHTLACTSDNDVAHNNLGNVLLQNGKGDEAIIHFQKVLQINPDNTDALYNLGNVLLQKGKVDEAIAQYQKELQINSDHAKPHYSLGNALLQKGKVDEAMAQYQMALQINPDYAEAHNNLGIALLQKGKVDEAMVHYQTALQINPENAEVHNNLGITLLQKGRVDEAIAHFQKVLQIKPDSLDVLNNLAWLLATCPDARIRDGVQAVKYAGRACELTHYGAAPMVGTLAAAYAEAGRFDEAIAAAEKTCVLATAAGERDLLEKNRELLVLYRAHQPYHAAEKFVPAAP
jgi:tetratricopeptide (TPR) repeat protein